MVRWRKETKVPMLMKISKQLLGFNVPSFSTPVPFHFAPMQKEYEKLWIAHSSLCAESTPMTDDHPKIESTLIDHA